MPKQINLNEETPAIPENVNFFKVSTNKLDDGSSKSICFNDVLFCIKSEINDPYFYILTKATGNKIGIIRSIDDAGNFTLESIHPDKSLFPDYLLNRNMFEDVYKLVSLSRNLPGATDQPEDWDDFDDVKFWEPETLEDQFIVRNNINKLNNNQL